MKYNVLISNNNRGYNFDKNNILIKLSAYLYFKTAHVFVHYVIANIGANNFNKPLRMFV